MPLIPIADKNGDITFTADEVLVGAAAEELRLDAFSIQTTGDPALDRILLAAKVDTLAKKLSRVGFTVVWQLGVALFGRAIIERLF